MGRWIRIVIALAMIAVLVLVGLSLANSLMSVLNGSDFSGGERDPMFAEEAEMVTRPPEIYPEETQKPHKTLDDYVMEESAPVDKTAQELIEEAQGGHANG